MEYESAAAQVKVTDSRKCTNVPWCFVYGIAWAVMFAFIVWAFLKGDYKRLHSGADDRGNVCGSDKMLNNATETFENKKYMFPMSFASPIKSLWICVEMCPNETIQNRTMLAKFASKYKVKLCDYHVPIAEYENEQKYPSAVNGTCPVMPILKSKPILNRCSPRIPKIKNDYYALPTLKYENYLANMCQDLSKTSTFIFFMTLSGLGLYIVYVCVIPCLNVILIKVFLVLITVASLLMTIVLWVCSFQNLEHWQISYVNMSSLNATITYDRSDIMYGAIAFTIFTILVCTVTVLMWSYMPFINAVFKQARTTLFFMPLLLILPVFSALTIIAMTLLFGFSFVSTITIVLAEMKKPRLLNVFKEAAKFGNAQIPVPFLFIFYICLYVWTCECMVAFQCLAISIPVANRLFNKNKSHKWFLGIQGVFIVLRYHVGSVIFAGALVALLRLFRTALTYIESKAKGCKQKLAKCATCITVATSLLRISNSATMAVIAVDGSNYCAAASNAGALIGGNLGKFGATYALCSAYMWIGKVIISITNAFIASAIFKTDEEINNYITPTIAVGLATYVLGGVFFNVFQSIVSTLAICYCIVQTEARLLRIKYFTSEQIDMYENMRDGEQADPSNTESLVEVKQPEKVRKESAGSSAYSDGRSHTSENRS